MKVYAHRGNKAEYPENSLQAFTSAIELGVDGIEVDVQLTKDQHPMIIHDETLDRTSTGQGYLKDLLATQVKEFHLLNPDGSKSSETIPRLEEMLALFDSLDFKGELNIELKTDQFDYDGIEQLVLKTVGAKKRAYHIIYSSFNWHTIQRLKDLDPEADIALLIAEPLLPYLAHIPNFSPNALHIDFRLIGHLSNELKAAYPIRLWTVNGESELRRWLTSDEEIVEAVMTDHPKLAIALRKTKN